MAVIQKGTGVVWGIEGNVYTGGIASATNAAQQQRSTVTRDSSKFELADESGEVVGQVFYNAKATFNTTVVPSGSTLNNATTSLVAWSPAPGTLVTIVSSEGIGDVVNSGKYNVVSATENRAIDAAATVDLVLEAYAANDVTPVIA